MIDKKDIENIVKEKLTESDELFLVDVKVSKSNNIGVYIDSDKDVDIDDCVALSNYIESKLDREKEDFELVVSSAGITSPLVMPRQYKKIIGKKVEILKSGSKKIIGTLIDADDTSFTIEEEKASKKKKKQDDEKEKLSFLYTDVNSVKLHIEFK